MNCIFVVEDEFDIQELLGNYLAEASYQVLAASDGVEAINLFEKEKDRIDLVLLDVMLPKIDGFGVLEVIRQSSLVPVIMLTALDDEAYQLKGYDLQADEYVTKPFSMQILLRKIGAVLRRSGKIFKRRKYRRSSVLWQSAPGSGRLPGMGRAKEAGAYPEGI